MGISAVASFELCRKRYIVGKNERHRDFAAPSEWFGVISIRSIVSTIDIFRVFAAKQVLTTELL